MTTNSYLKNIELNNRHPFDRKLWQRNYYERIIRNENELFKVREYIKIIRLNEIQMRIIP